MKYIVLVLWTFSLFLLMFSSFPFRVECRPTKSLGPPQPSPNFSKKSDSSSSVCPWSASRSLTASPLPIPAQIWPDSYPLDITTKVWDSPLVLEGMARSRSDVRPDGSFGLTFDLIRVVKGEAPILERRKQFRLQFIDSPTPLPSNSNNNHQSLNIQNVKNTKSAVGGGRKLKRLTSNLNNNNNNKNPSPSSLSTSQLIRARTERLQLQRKLRRAEGPESFQKNNLNNNTTTITRLTKSSAISINSNNNNVNLNKNNCQPPKAYVKTGRKYLVFASKWENHFLAVYSPELANKRNLKAIEKVLCKGCGQAPSLRAPKELVLKPKKRLRIQCRLRTGNPLPIMTWYKYDNKDAKPVNISDTRQYRLRVKRRQSILVIRNPSEDDVGLYKCEAMNVFGSAHAIIKVTLPKRPLKSPQITTSKGVDKIPIKVGTTPTTLWPLYPSACPYDSYCLNGGTCSYYETIGEYVCQCAEGYKGQRCDTKDLRTSSIFFNQYFCIGNNNPHYLCHNS